MNNRMGRLEDESMLEIGLLEPTSSNPSRKSVLTRVRESGESLIRLSGLFSKSNSKKPLSRTAYLDGLRGFSALLVYILHHQVWGHAGMGGEFILENAYGWNRQFYFVCLPGVRVLFSGGHLAVAIFFVISGYVLSAKPLSLIHAGETVQIANNLGSALFRRWLRLFIPVIATTFLWLTSWHLFGLKSLAPGALVPERTYLDELWKWYIHLKNYTFVFHEDPAFVYNDHAWSLALEFKGSIVVYTSLMACSRCSRDARLMLEAGMVFYFLYIVDGWYCSLFAMGMLLCDLDLLAMKNNLPPILGRFKQPRTEVFHVLLALGLFLGGVPSITGDLDHLRKSPGWYYLSFLKPQAVFDQRWFYRFWAATFIMVALPRIASLKCFFETTFIRFLGKVSFSFYLVHGPVLWTLGDRVYAATGRVRQEHAELIPGWINLCPFPSWGPFGLEVNFLMAQVVLFPVTLGLAKLVTELIDEPSVTITQSMYKKAQTLNENEKPEFGVTSHASGKRARFST